jgi:hypothetical protein
MKVTARNLEFARELADRAVRSIDPHVFKGASEQFFNSPTAKGAQVLPVPP